MLRTNETSRVGAVLEHARAGDRTAMIKAAVELWVAPQEIESDDDPAHAEVWSAIIAANAVDDAVAAVLAVIRDGQRVRPRAFVDVSEAIADPAIHRELVERVIATSWDPAWYLATALMRLVEAKREREVWELVQKHRERMFRDDAMWRTVAVLLTTTRVGDRNDLDAWFQGWVQRKDVPMWLLHAYASTLASRTETLDRLIKLSELALEHATRDVTSAFFEAYVQVDNLRQRMFGTFREKMWELEPELDQLAATPILEHPAARFINRVKHAHPVDEPDLEIPDSDASLILVSGLFPVVGVGIAAALAAKAIAKAASTKPPVAFNARIGEQLYNIRKYTTRLTTVLRVFAAMWDLERDDPKVFEFCKAMAKSRPSEMPWLKGAWEHVVKTRTSWTTRVKLALF